MKYSENVKKLYEEMKSLIVKKKAINVSKAKKVVGKVPVKAGFFYSVNLATGDVVETDMNNALIKDRSKIKQEIRAKKFELAKSKESERMQKAKTSIERRSKVDGKKSERKFKLMLFAQEKERKLREKIANTESQIKKLAQ